MYGAQIFSELMREKGIVLFRKGVEAKETFLAHEDAFVFPGFRTSVF